MDLGRLLVAEHSGSGNAKLIDVDLQHDILHLMDMVRKTQDGGQGLLDDRHAAGQNTAFTRSLMSIYFLYREKTFWSHAHTHTL